MKSRITDIRAEEGERIDEIGFGGLKLIQKPEAFCYGVDAVILSDFAASAGRSMEKVCDLGTGTGIIPLIISHKRPESEIVAVEVQKDSAGRAERNVVLNGLEDRIRIVCSDILDLDRKYYGTFDTVVSNPPYMAGGGAIRNANMEKMIARHETTATLRDFFRCASDLLKARGELFMVHRPSRLPDLITLARDEGLEPKTMRLVCPREGEAANIVLIHYVKGGGAEMKIMADLNVHRREGGYTEEILRIYEKEGEI